jgi:hypothetical protein
MPEKIEISKTLSKRLKKITLSNERTGLLYKFIIDKNGIREISDTIYTPNHKSQIEISEENYLIRIEIEKNSNKEANLYLTTFKDFIIIEGIQEDYVAILPLNSYGRNTDFNLSIKGHQIKLIIQKTNS